uniref:Uncharacterized protein n=1 Tax=Parascaris univalens TaxID=6257 RepID=A0A914ZXM6_PARUN
SKPLQLTSSLLHSPASIQRATISFRSARLGSSGTKSILASGGGHRSYSSHNRSLGGTTAADAPNYGNFSVSYLAHQMISFRCSLRIMLQRPTRHSHSISIISQKNLSRTTIMRNRSNS